MQGWFLSSFLSVRATGRMSGTGPSGSTAVFRVLCALWWCCWLLGGDYRDRVIEGPFFLFVTFATTFRSLPSRPDSRSRPLRYDGTPRRDEGPNPVGVRERQVAHGEPAGRDRRSGSRSDDLYRNITVGTFVRTDDTVSCALRDLSYYGRDSRGPGSVACEGLPGHWSCRYSRPACQDAHERHTPRLIWTVHLVDGIGPSFYVCLLQVSGPGVTGRC